MTRLRRNGLLAGASFLVATIVAAVAFREPMQALTEELLTAAQVQWREQGLGDYHFTYRMHGAIYEVQVSGSIVTGLLVNGQPSSSADWGAYSVEGHFETLSLELDNRASAIGPFAGQGGAVFLRVRFHPELGYIERYLRSGGTGGRSVAIEVLSFKPHG